MFGFSSCLKLWKLWGWTLIFLRNFAHNVFISIIYSSIIYSSIIIHLHNLFIHNLFIHNLFISTQRKQVTRVRKCTAPILFKVVLWSMVMPCANVKNCFARVNMILFVAPMARPTLPSVWWNFCHVKQARMSLRTTKENAAKSVSTFPPHGPHTA